MIEPLVSSQWFVKTEGMGAKALAAVEDGEIQILPERCVRWCWTHLGPDLINSGSCNIVRYSRTPCPLPPSFNVCVS